MPTGNQSALMVSAAKPRSASGSVFSAPVTAKVPTDPFSELGPEFVSLGYISEDGITNGVESDSEQIVAFGGDTVLTIKTSHQETFVFRPIEKSEAVLADTWGHDNVEMVDDDHGTYLKAAHSSKEIEPRIYVFELSLSNGRIERMVVPNGKVTEVGENAIVHTDAQGHELTVTASVDESGITCYEYIARVEDAVDPDNPKMTVKASGTEYGLDLSTLGDYSFDGERFTGKLNKVTCPEYNGKSKPKEGYFVAWDVKPASGTKVWKTPGGTKGNAKAIDDGFVVCLVGESSVDVTEIHTLGVNGAEHTYAVECTASE